MRFSLFIIYIIFVLFSAQAIAAAPVTHAYLAKNWADYRESFDPLEEASFMRGTLFPDIRRLKVITRKETHDEEISLQDVLDDTIPFSKGIKLHSYVDKKRHQFVVKNKMYDHLKMVPRKYRGTFLKLLEDEILFYKKDWSKVRATLSTLDEGHLRYNIKRMDLIKWHALTERAFYIPPTGYIRQTLANPKLPTFGIPREILKEWDVLLPKLAKEEKFNTHVKNLIREFDSTPHKPNLEKNYFIPTFLLTYPNIMRFYYKLTLTTL